MANARWTESRACVLVARSISLQLGSVLLVLACRHQQDAASTPQPRCEAIKEVVGRYSCSGECVVTKADGTREVVQVSGETDTVRRYPGAAGELFEVSIESGTFSELEIGALVGDTLRTATAQVSDAQYPVLEEYVFAAGPSCEARSFSKVVRNPSQASFKSCLIRCQKSQ
jgi:hypothetical protein